MDIESQDNIYYLKSFVKQHPDNRMAWYLLGKQYEEQGKAAKANYCYLQAGDIYEAFERKSHPLISIEQELEQLKIWQEQKRARNRRLRTIGIAALLFLLMLGTHEGPGHQQTVYSPEEEAQPTNRPTPEPAVVLADLQEKVPFDETWGRMVMLGQTHELVIAAKLAENKDWRLWLGEKRPLMSAETAEEGAKREVELYDAAACECEPADSGSMMEMLQKWSADQETRFVLSSAIQAYRMKYGEWPADLDSLIRPYPDNVLAGERAGMREQFAPLLEQLKARHPDAAAGGSGGNDGGGTGETAGTSPSIIEAIHSEPLEIIVDKSTHRLAVVSGNIIIRSYAVGLGGDATPEGEFVVSEKVRNPNGTDKGPFGSRGLVLSDTNYAIHGTDEPDSIGRDESLGCVRMSRGDLEELYDIVPLETKVSIKKGVIPPETATQPEYRFQLVPGQDETNPDKVYQWLN